MRHLANNKSLRRFARILFAQSLMWTLPSCAARCTDDGLLSKQHDESCEAATTQATTEMATTAGDGDTDTDTDTDTQTGTDTDTDTDTGTDTDTSDSDGECVPTEDIEVTCDDIDNDCDGLIDNIDAGDDGFCDCLDVGILGTHGINNTSNFEAWLEARGITVVRTEILDSPGIVDDEFLSAYDVVIVDRIQRVLSPAETTAVENFVTGGRGLITLIGYNFDGGDPAPESTRANSVLSSFGLAYEGPYLDVMGATPMFAQGHPISTGITDVNYIGGIEPVDNGNLGDSFVFATVSQGDAGIAHETAAGGRVVAWGDEWITFDSDWMMFEHVPDFWAQMIAWVTPTGLCSSSS